MFRLNGTTVARGDIRRRESSLVYTKSATVHIKPVGEIATDHWCKACIGEHGYPTGWLDGIKTLQDGEQERPNCPECDGTGSCIEDLAYERDAMPGSELKIAVLQARYASGVPLWLDGDLREQRGGRSASDAV